MQLNLLDYIIIAIMLLSILAGFKLGFIKAVTRIIDTILGIVLAFVWYDDLLTYLNYNFEVQANLSEFILSKLLLNIFPTDFLILADYFPIETKLTEIAHNLSYYIMMIISFCIIFVLSKLGLRIIMYFLEGLFSCSFLSWLNRLLGMVIIPVKNLIVLIILLGLFNPAIELAAQIGSSGALMLISLINDSMIAGNLLNCFQLIKAWIIV